MKPLTKAESTAAEIINMLSERRGFDGWWEEISRENQRDIMYHIAEVIENNESRDQN